MSVRIRQLKSGLNQDMMQSPAGCMDSNPEPGIAVAKLKKKGTHSVRKGRMSVEVLF